MNQKPVLLTLNLEIEEVNKILTGLNYYKRDIENLAQRIVQVSQIQIDEHNQKIQEEQEKASKKANKEEGDKK